MAESAQAKIWNASVGETWVEHADHFDATLAPFGEAVIERLHLRSGDRVVDLGCGTGETTVRLATLVAPATVTGLDISAPMLAAARARAATAGVSNTTFTQCDVEAAPFGDGLFDVAFSRCGVMFFVDPEQAFTHVRRSLVEGGRLAFVCFQPMAANPFIVVPIMAAAPHLHLPPPAGPTDPGPFSLADPERTTAILTAAGFGQVVIEAGPSEAVLGDAEDLDALAQRVLEQNPGAGPALANATPAERQAAIAASAEALEPHCTAGKVTLAASTWIVTATAG